VAIFEVTGDALVPLSETTFVIEGMRERDGLQGLLRDHIEVVGPDLMVLAEEFGSWEDSRRRIDLLALDHDGSLVVIELKRDADGHMDLQAIRYAAMVSAMTFDQAVEAHAAYLEQRDREGDAREAILEFLGWDEPDEDEFAQQVRIMLVAGSFSVELTTAVLWLNAHDLDLRCVRLKPYALDDGRVLIDVQQVIPLPEARDYQVKVREKVRREQQQRRQGRDLTKFDVIIEGHLEPRLPKNRAMHRVIAHLVSRGVTPDQIRAVVGRDKTLWRVADGELDSEAFRTTAAAAAANGGPRFDPWRWFHADDELIHHGGRTWSLSKGWGRRTEEQLDSLLAAFSGHGISVEPTADE
jgi:hypothetical protein